MSDLSGSVPSLQFDRAEFVAAQPPSATCASCNQSIFQSYYEAAGKTLCATCRDAHLTGAQSGGTRRFVRALLIGLAAAIAGSVLWWGVRKATDMEIGLVSIAIGIGVGRAVRFATGNRGGRAYQVLAVVLTYLSITGNYIPDVIAGVHENIQKEEAAEKTPSSAPAGAKTVKASAAAADDGVGLGGILLGLGAIVMIAAAAPFLAGASNIIGILIIAFGLWEAWKVNRKVDVVITGPYSVAPAANVI